MQPFFIELNDIDSTRFDYNKKSVLLKLKPHSKATIINAILPEFPIDIHVGDSVNKHKAFTIWEDCIIKRRKHTKKTTELTITYLSIRNSGVADIRPYLIDEIMITLGK